MWLDDQTDIHHDLDKEWMVWCDGRNLLSPDNQVALLHRYA